MSLSNALLALYITCETTRANYAYYVLQESSKITPALIALSSEILKLVVACGFLSISDIGLNVLWEDFDDPSKRTRTFRSALPAGIYLTNTLIYFTALPLVSPSLLQVCILAKLPTTGILHHVMIKKQRNVYAWSSLFWLCIGLILFNMPDSTTGSSNGSWWIGPAAGLAIACLSALASIYTETLTKTGGFWESQAWLYFWGVAFAALSYPVSGFFTMSKSADHHEVSTLVGVFLAAALMIITGATGLAVALILRKRDNLLKVVGTSATLVTIAATQLIFMPDSRASLITPWKIFGGGLVTVSTWCYNFYQNQPWPSEKETVYSHLIVEGDFDSHGPNMQKSFLDESDHSEGSGSSKEVLDDIEMGENVTKVEGVTRNEFDEEDEHLLETVDDSVEVGANPKTAHGYFDPSANKVAFAIIIIAFVALHV